MNLVKDLLQITVLQWYRCYGFMKLSLTWVCSNFLKPKWPLEFHLNFFVFVELYCGKLHSLSVSLRQISFLFIAHPFDLLLGNKNLAICLLFPTETVHKIIFLISMALLNHKHYFNKGFFETNVLWMGKFIKSITINFVTRCNWINHKWIFFG